MGKGELQEKKIYQQVFVGGVMVMAFKAERRKDKSSHI